MSRSHAPARSLRGALVAASGLGIAAGGHVYAGGDATPTPLVVLVSVLVTAATVLTSRSRWTASRLVLALLGMQVAMHATFWFETGARGVDDRLAALASAAGAHQHANPAASPVGMVLAHVVAVVAAAVLIAAIDGAIWLLRALARQLLRAVTGLVAPALLRPVADLVGVATIGVLELGAIGRRGPPAAAAPV